MAHFSDRFPAGSRRVPVPSAAFADKRRTGIRRVLAAVLAAGSLSLGGLPSAAAAPGGAVALQPDDAGANYCVSVNGRVLRSSGSAQCSSSAGSVAIAIGARTIAHALNGTHSAAVALGAGSTAYATQGDDNTATAISSSTGQAAHAAATGDAVVGLGGYTAVAVGCAAHADGANESDVCTTTEAERQARRPSRNPQPPVGASPFTANLCVRVVGAPIVRRGSAQCDPGGAAIAIGAGSAARITDTPGNVAVAIGSAAFAQAGLGTDNIAVANNDGSEAIAGGQQGGPDNIAIATEGCHADAEGGGVVDTCP